MEEITSRTYIDKDLGRMIEEEFYKLRKKGMDIEKTIKVAVPAAMKAWRKKYAVKSGG